MLESKIKQKKKKKKKKQDQQGKPIKQQKTEKDGEKVAQYLWFQACKPILINLRPGSRNRWGKVMGLLQSQPNLTRLLASSYLQY